MAALENRGLFPFCSFPVFVGFIRADDFPHQRMPDDIPPGHFDATDVPDMSQPVDGIGQAAVHMRRKIDLCDIPGDDDLRIVPPCV